MSEPLLDEGTIVRLDGNEFKVSIVDYGDGTHGYWLACTDPSAIFNMYQNDKEVEAALLSGRMKLGKETTTDCSHWFERYTGFTETYRYCIYCDRKEFDQ